MHFTDKYEVSRAHKKHANKPGKSCKKPWELEYVKGNGVNNKTDVSLLRSGGFALNNLPFKHNLKEQFHSWQEGLSAFLPTVDGNPHGKWHMSATEALIHTDSVIRTSCPVRLSVFLSACSGELRGEPPVGLNDRSLLEICTFVLLSPGRIQTGFFTIFYENKQGWKNKSQ